MIRFLEHEYSSTHKIQLHFLRESQLCIKNSKITREMPLKWPETGILWSITAIDSDILFILSSAPMSNGFAHSQTFEVRSWWCSNVGFMIFMDFLNVRCWLEFQFGNVNSQMPRDAYLSRTSQHNLFMPNVFPSLLEFSQLKHVLPMPLDGGDVCFRYWSLIDLQ